MSSKIYSVELSGLDGQLVEIEVDNRMSLPGFSIVGLPDAAVMEARERVMSSVKNAGIALPRGRIVVNLAPADMKKVGARYDLPIALGLIAFSGIISEASFRNTAFLGELALDGHVRPITGILASAEFARRKGFRRLFVPKENAQEAAVIKGIEVIPVNHLKEAILHLNREIFALPIKAQRYRSGTEPEVDMAMIRGQSQAKRALEIAAAGGHNILFNGAPGAGKTLMAKALRGILPDMTQEEMLEVTKIYSIAGLLPDKVPLIEVRPFRLVHHTASAVSIVGGGGTPMPGEITLAHKGILFLDEIAEFPGQVLEVLRQPLEDKRITISRARATITYPAQFTLIGAMNPCPCGYFKIEKFKGRCQCLAWKIKDYKRRLSGPLLDRIDMHINVEPLEYADLVNSTLVQENSKLVKQRVNEAYLKQLERLRPYGINRNSEMNSRIIEKLCPLSDKGKQMMERAVNRLGFSARGYFRAIKLARTIADLQGSEFIAEAHIYEAIHYMQIHPPVESAASLSGK